MAVSLQPAHTTRYGHEAALYRGAQGFLDATVDFVRDGLAGAQPVLVAVVPDRIKLLREALGDDADQVRFVDLAETGRNPARIIPLWREFVDAHHGTPVRGIGEPVWAGRRSAELAEALLHEALLNLAFPDDPPLLLRCPYDADALGDAMVDEAHRRHPCVVAGGTRPGRGYHGPDAAAAEFAAPLPEVDAPVEAVDFRQLSGIRQLRALVAERAASLGIGPDRGLDLAMAVHEIAVNSLRHGGGHGTLRIWSDEASLVCEVRDGGHIREPLVGRVRPDPRQVSGRGVWLANQLCDLVQIRSSAAGTQVRLHMAR
jgi:anti-sigma regulatory factor (Ser/Thr protein kinase)